MEVVKLGKVRNALYYFVGAALMILNYIRHTFCGYRTPRAFSIRHFEKSADYDFDIVRNWMRHLLDYSRGKGFLQDKTVLELCPGPDLGTGLLLLALGARKYVALDINGLALSTPPAFYDGLLSRIKAVYPGCDINYLREELDKCYERKPSALAYVVDEDFDISRLRERFDIVFSQAAFEHFTDIKNTLAALNRVVKPQGLSVIEIDLRTHTRWIREVDPLNIYRYGDLLWNLFKFNGSPNRMRVPEYTKVFEKNGWSDIRVIPENILEDGYVAKVKPALDRKFRDADSSEMRILDFMLLARKR